MATKRHSILVVEDERIVARDLQESLREMGYDAYAIAASAENALTRATERCPDVVLMDIRIKGARDGIECARLLREQFDVPIVFLTAHADEATLARATTVNPHGYVLKPVKDGELRAAVELAVHRHGIEKRLRENEQRLTTTLRSMHDAVVSVDLRGNVAFMNAAAERLTGVAADAAAGRPVREVMPTVAPAMSETIIDGDENVRAVMVIRDVTEAKVVDKRAELAERLASLSTMAGGVAHEINNPLAVLVSNIDFALARIGDLRASAGAAISAEVGGALDEIAETLRENEAASARITRIVRDLRVFGAPPTPDTRSDVARAVEWAMRATQQELRARACVTAAVAEVPAVTVDPTRLRQIVVNLLLNAARAIKPGNPTEEAVALAVRMTPDAKQVVIEVRDTGEGMSPEVQKRMFEPFFTTRAVGEGKGLGLAVCHGIVHAAGGEMQVESVQGKGSVFRVLLPVAPATPAPAFASVSESTRGRILVVDDEPALLRAVQRTLRTHDTVLAESVDAAMRTIEQEPAFDMIISDVVMPERDGLAFYEALLARYPALASRVVFLTGGALSPKQQAFFDSIPNLCLTKPFDAAGLIRVVNEQLAAVR